MNENRHREQSAPTLERKSRVRYIQGHHNLFNLWAPYFQLTQRDTAGGSGGGKIILENKRTILENKRTILGIKQFWFLGSKRAQWLQNKGTCNLTNPLWSCHFWKFQTKVKFQNFFYGHFLPMGQISWPLNSLKYPLTVEDDVKLRFFLALQKKWDI